MGKRSGFMEKRCISGMAAGDINAIKHFKEAVARGEHWRLALLEAIRQWSSIEENYAGRYYCYFIGGEAFDWLLLAERLMEEIKEFVQEDERIEFLFHTWPVVYPDKNEFRSLIGAVKYKACLNYFYGVLVEEFLVLAEVEEMRKLRRGVGLNNDKGVLEEAYCKLYGETQQELLQHFRQEKQYLQRRTISLTELKEFTYWLFKRRVNRSERSRVASDTEKALAKMYSSFPATGHREL